jgi:hypothetical protein
MRTLAVSPGRSSALVVSRRDPVRLFDIAPSDGGLWRVCDRKDLVEGLFRSRRDAVHFALFEVGGRCNAVVLDPLTTETGSA